MLQEHGHKTDVFWLTLTNGDGHGVKVECFPSYEFSASHFSANDLYKASHILVAFLRQVKNTPRR